MAITMDKQNTVSSAETNVIDTNSLPILQDLDSYKMRLREDPNVQNLTSLIEINNPDSVIVFGQEPSQNISKISDKMLSSIKSVKPEEVSKMLLELNKLMDKFDIKELDPEMSKSFIGRMKLRFSESLNKLFEKYEDMGKEVDRIYQLLSKYERDIYKANDMLKEQFDSNVQYYQELEKYIVAGEIGLEEIENHKSQYMQRTDIDENTKTMYIQKIDLIYELLSQRVQDLRIAENVAMQTCPMIQMNQMSNYNLLRKINSSFIITLPIFKQCLVQAIQLKRQKIQADAIKQLDDRTNELLLRNAQSTATQSVQIAKLAGGSSIQVETLQKTYETIKQGIEETRAVNDEIARKRVEDAKTLEGIKKDMQNSGLLSSQIV